MEKKGTCGKAFEPLLSDLYGDVVGERMATASLQTFLL